MKITVDAQALAKALQRIAAIPARTALPILSSVLLSAEDDSLTLTVHSLTVGAQRALKARVDAPGTLAIPAEALLSLVRHLTGELSLESDDLALRLRWRTGRAGLPGVNPDEFPRPPFLEPGFSVPAEAFRRALRRVLYAASEDTQSMDDAILQAICVRIAGTSVRTLATDRCQVAIAREAIPDVGLSQELLFPASSLQALFRLAPNAETFEIASSERSLTVRAEDTLFHSRVLAGTYPDVIRLLPKAYPVHSAVDGTLLVEALDRAESLYRRTAPDGAALRVEISPQGLRLSLTEAALTEELPGESVGAASLLLDPGKLLKSVKTCGIEGRIEIGFSTTEGPVRIRVPGAPDMAAFLMPIQEEAASASPDVKSA